MVIWVYIRRPEVSVSRPAAFIVQLLINAVASFHTLPVALKSRVDFLGMTLGVTCPLLLSFSDSIYLPMPPSLMLI